jgi:hypothetical protein
MASPPPCPACLEVADKHTIQGTCWMAKFNRLRDRYNRVQSEVSTVLMRNGELEKAGLQKDQQLKTKEQENQALSEKLADAESRVSALKEALEQRKLKDAEQQALEAMDNMDIDGDVTSFQGPAPPPRNPCILVVGDRTLNGIRGGKTLDVYQEFGGYGIFGLWRCRNDMTIEDAVGLIQRFLQTYTHITVHVLVMAGAANVAKSSKEMTRAETLAQTMVTALSSLRKNYEQVQSVTWYSMIEHPGARSITTINELIRNTEEVKSKEIFFEDLRLLSGVDANIRIPKEEEHQFEATYSHAGRYLLAQWIRSAVRQNLDLNNEDLQGIEQRKAAAQTQKETRTAAKQKQHEEAEEKKAKLQEALKKLQPETLCSKCGETLNREDPKKNTPKKVAFDNPRESRRRGRSRSHSRNRGNADSNTPPERKQQQQQRSPKKKRRRSRSASRPRSMSRSEGGQHRQQTDESVAHASWQQPGSRAQGAPRPKTGKWTHPNTPAQQQRGEGRQQNLPERRNTGPQQGHSNSNTAGGGGGQP